MSNTKATNQTGLPPAAQRALSEAKARRALSEAKVHDESNENKEKGGPKGKEPTRFGDWERKGIAYDF